MVEGGHVISERDGRAVHRQDDTSQGVSSVPLPWSNLQPDWGERRLLVRTLQCCQRYDTLGQGALALAQRVIHRHKRRLDMCGFLPSAARPPGIPPLRPCGRSQSG